MNPILGRGSSARRRVHMRRQALFSSKDKAKHKVSHAAIFALEGLNSYVQKEMELFLGQRDTKIDK